LVAAVHHAVFGFAWRAQVIASALAGPAAPQTPRGAPAAVGALEVPFPVDEVAQLEVDAQAAAELARARRIAAQRARLHQYRALHLDALDRAVAHVALADGDRGRFAVLEGTAAPAAAFDALHHEAAPGLRVNAEEHHRPPEEAVMRGRNPVGHRLSERADDGLDHGRDEDAPAGHGRRVARHHDVAFGDDHLERAERALVHGGERRGDRLVG